MQATRFFLSDGNDMTVRGVAVAIEHTSQTSSNVPVVGTRTGSVADGLRRAPSPAIGVEYRHRIQPPAVLHPAEDDQFVGIGQEAASVPAAATRYLTRHCVTKEGGGGGGESSES